MRTALTEAATTAHTTRPLRHGINGLAPFRVCRLASMWFTLGPRRVSASDHVLAGLLCLLIEALFAVRGVIHDSILQGYLMLSSVRGRKKSARNNRTLREAGHPGAAAWNMQMRHGLPSGVCKQ